MWLDHVQLWIISHEKHSYITISSQYPTSHIWLGQNSLSLHKIATSTLIPSEIGGQVLSISMHCSNGRFPGVLELE